MTVAELIAKLKGLPPEAEIVCSGYGTPLPSLVIHSVDSYGDQAFLSLCTPETAKREKAWEEGRRQAREAFGRQ